MISVMMEQQGMTLQEAVDFVGNLCKQSIDRFEAARSSLPSWSPEVDRNVQIYVEGLQDWIVGAYFIGLLHMIYPDFDPYQVPCIGPLIPRGISARWARTLKRNALSLCYRGKLNN